MKRWMQYTQELECELCMLWQGLGSWEIGGGNSPTLLVPSMLPSLESDFAQLEWAALKFRRERNALIKRKLPQLGHLYSG